MADDIILVDDGTGTYIFRFNIERENRHACLHQMMQRSIFIQLEGSDKKKNRIKINIITSALADQPGMFERELSFFRLFLENWQ